MPPRILIAEHEPVHRHLLETSVHRLGYVTETVECGEAVLARLEAGDRDLDAQRIDLLILDLALPGLEATAVLARLAARDRSVPIIVETVSGAIEAVLPAIRAGACDFVMKPVRAERLEVSIRNALRLDALESEVRRLDRHGSRCLSFEDLALASPAMDRVVRLGQRAAKSTIPVLLEGETGVGKEVVARAIHGASERRGRPFVTVACSGLSEPDVESVLFGHDKGAIGGTAEKRTGKLVEANGGTLFLDRVNDLPLETQGKLLRALQAGEVEPVGSKRSVRVDSRLVCTTDRNLIDLVTCGRFREDLYYRLNVFPISIPALRHRREDISDLARRFCARFAAEEGKRLGGLGAEALALLDAYDWPENVRQLENAVFRAVVLADSDELTVSDFPQVAARVQGFDARVPPAPTRMPREREFVRVEVRDPDTIALLDKRGGMRRLDDLEAEAIRFALGLYRGQISAVARRLGIGRSTLYRKMKEYGLASAAELSNDAAEIPRAASGIDGAAA